MSTPLQWDGHDLEGEVYMLPEDQQTEELHFLADDHLLPTDGVLKQFYTTRLLAFANDMPELLRETS